MNFPTQSLTAPAKLGLVVVAQNELVDVDVRHCDTSARANVQGNNLLLCEQRVLGPATPRNKGKETKVVTDRRESEPYPAKPVRLFRFGFLP